MSDRLQLNIIAFDVPYPANYGGIVDVLFKLKSLHAAGVSITYHCFYYKGHNPPAKELEKYCDKLFYYERKKSLFKLFFSRLPYIVTTRNNAELLINLFANPGPVLMDGIQCTYWLLHEDIHHKGILFRANNIEHEYYDSLANEEKNLLKKWYLRSEAKKLRNFEWQLRHADAILCVAKQDIPHFEQYSKTYHIPPFLDDSEHGDLQLMSGIGDFVLFQGNLSVRENEKAAEHIIQSIAPLTKHKIIIAGKDPSASLLKSAENMKHVQIIASPPQEKMAELIGTAQVNLLMTFQQTGIKLKLLHALQSGKHIIINSKMEDGDIFGQMCEVIDDSKEVVNRIDQLMQIEFSPAMKAERDLKFNAIYANDKKANQIIEIMAELAKRKPY